MAAMEAVFSYNAEVEASVNRWIVDYYSFLALELFKNQKYAEFCDVRDLLHSVLVRPLESTDVLQTKIRVLQFLSRINDGEHFGEINSNAFITSLTLALMCIACFFPFLVASHLGFCVTLPDTLPVQNKTVEIFLTHFELFHTKYKKTPCVNK
uniref:Uncharacterized protein n=1 Tax=Cyclopterus lumpus TaxID=8103 RepID=A0A8C2WM81_CYCLU